MNNIPSPDVVFPNEYGTSCFLKNVIAAPSITVGDCTYYDGPADPAAFERNSGKFCSIASGVKFIMGSASHRLSGISAYPFSVFGGLWTERTPPRLSQLPFKGDTVAGNDVWPGVRGDARRDHWGRGHRRGVLRGCRGCGAPCRRGRESRPDSQKAVFPGADRPAAPAPLAGLSAGKAGGLPAGAAQ